MKFMTTFDTAYHRNGIAGMPFDVILFHVPNEEGPKIAIVFADKGYCAVLDIAKLAAGDIAVGSNSWRGDTYEPMLRRVIQHTRNLERRPA